MGKKAEKQEGNDTWCHTGKTKDKNVLLKSKEDVAR